MIQVITDTTSTLTLTECKELGIELLPQIIVFEEKEYRDDYEISAEQFLDKLRTSPTLPHTAAPSPALYNPIYEKVLSKGDTALVLCPSAKVSGTFRSASIAAKDFPTDNIHIIDTEIIGPAFGFVVQEADMMAKNGKGIDEITSWIKSKCKKLIIYFYVDTLEYLQKGGRIGLAKALVGSVLQIKPILQFKDGQVNPFENQRTKKRAIARIIDLVKNGCSISVENNLSIFHAAAMEDALYLKSELQALSPTNEIKITNLPPAIVVHAGPGVVAVSFFSN
jgi:DegV family protein with EDD domain